MAGLAAATTLFVLLPAPVAISGTALTSILVALSVIDSRVQILPDVLTFPLIAIGMILALAGAGPPILDACLGGLFGYLVIALIAYSYRKTRGIDGLGMGDAKLLCGLGVWTGALMLPFIVLGASLGGLAWYGMRNFRALHLQHQMPFGPFLAIAGWIAFLAERRGIDPIGRLADCFANWMS